MKRETIAQLKEHFAALSDDLRGRPPGEVEIEAAQTRLGCRFHEDYIEFLRLFGCGIVGPDYIFGLGATDEFGKNENVVHQTERFRKYKWPGIDGWYIVSGDGRGNPVGVAPDGQVYLSDHDVGDVPMIAESFEEFLLQRLNR